jgi:hypothetical protein
MNLYHRLCAALDSPQVAQATKRMLGEVPVGRRPEALRVATALSRTIVRELLSVLGHHNECSEISCRWTMSVPGEFVLTAHSDGKSVNVAWTTRDQAEDVGTTWWTTFQRGQAGSDREAIQSAERAARQDAAAIAIALTSS